MLDARAVLTRRKTALATLSVQITRLRLLDMKLAQAIDHASVKATQLDKDLIGLLLFDDERRHLPPALCPCRNASRA